MQATKAHVDQATVGLKRSRNTTDLVLRVLNTHVLWQAFEYLLRAQEVLVEHVKPQQDGTTGGEERELPSSAAHEGTGRGQHVQLQVQHTTSCMHLIMNLTQ